MSILIGGRHSGQAIREDTAMKFLGLFRRPKILEPSRATGREDWADLPRVSWMAFRQSTGLGITIGVPTDSPQHLKLQTRYHADLHKDRECHVNTDGSQDHWCEP